MCLSVLVIVQMCGTNVPVYLCASLNVYVHVHVYAGLCIYECMLHIYL